MTTTPAMPELPKPFAYLCDWGNDSFGLPCQIVYYDEPGNAIDDDWNEHPKVHQNEPFYSANQMRAYALATLQAQAQPAAVSDADVWELWLRVCAESDNLSTRVMIANFALRPQAESEARKAAQEQLYTEREHHAAEVKRLQAEIGRLQSLRPQAVTMTDEQLCAALDIDGSDDWTYKVRDAVEAHHGITAQAKEVQK